MRRIQTPSEIEIEEGWEKGWGETKNKVLDSKVKPTRATASALSQNLC